MLYHRTNRVQRPPIYRDEFILVPGHVYSVPTANCLEGMNHRADIARGTVKCPYRGQRREYSICSAKEYRGQGRENTEDKNGVLREQFNTRKRPWRRYHIAPRSVFSVLTIKTSLPFVAPYTRRRNLLLFTAELLFVGIYFGFVNAKA